MKIIGILTTIIFLVSCQTTQQIFESVPEAKGVANVLQDLVEAYETENSLRFMNDIDDQFQTVSSGGNNLNKITLQRSIKDDFLLLDNIRFQIFVTSVQVSPDGQETRVRVDWDRRAVISQTSKLWNLRSQTSELIFRKQPGIEANWKLSDIRNDSIFGLADLSGKISVRDGEIDNSRVTKPIDLRR